MCMCVVCVSGGGGRVVRCVMCVWCVCEGGVCVCGRSLTQTSALLL